MEPETAAQPDQAAWDADESLDDPSGIELGDVRGDLLAERPGAETQFNNAAARRDAERRRFANVAQAHDAASLLQQALGLPAPEAISARWSRCRARRVEYLSDSSRGRRCAEDEDGS